MKNAILIIALFTTTITLAGWERTYGGSDYDYGHSVIQTSDSGYAIVGFTDSFDASGHDLYIIKTDSAGDTLWTRIYGGSGDQIGFSIEQTSDNGYIIAGDAYTYDGSEYNVYLVKTDSGGDTLWTRTYGGSGWDEGRSVTQTSDGGYIIAGIWDTWGSADFYLIKTDSVGETLWTRTYGGSEDDRGYSVVQTSDSGYVIAGYTNSFGGSEQNIYLIKTDCYGDTLWTRTYSGSLKEIGRSVAQTSDGGYIIAGWRNSHGASGWDYYLIKTDSYGDTLWTRTYGESYDDMGFSVAQTSDGGYIIAGIWNYWSNTDVYLVKTNSGGDTLWTRIYGGSDLDYGYSVAQTFDGGYIIAGITGSIGAGSHDVYLIKTNSLGFTGIEENPPSAKPAAFNLSAHPNPFNSAVSIALEFSPPSQGGDAQRAEGVNIEIFDLNGRRVDVIARRVTPDAAISPVAEKDCHDLRSCNDGASEFIWQPAPTLGSGVYLLRAKAGEGQTVTKRIVYLK